MTGYNLIELCTSGMTHHANSLLKVSEPIMQMATPQIWESSGMKFDYNFGLVKIKRVDQDV